MHNNTSANERVFFFCTPTVSAKNASYHDLAISIAEGLNELGVEFYANINYWQLSPDEEEYLFKYDPDITPDNCSIVVVSQTWFLRKNPFPQFLFHPGRRYKTVYLDRSDGSKTFSWDSKFRQFDLILKPHCSSKAWYPSNFSPWAFGLTNRIIDEAKNQLPLKDRVEKILINFRNKPDDKHTVRKRVMKEFAPQIDCVLSVDNKIEREKQPPTDPLENLLWFQTGRRHYKSYYQRLGSARANACFGGFFVSSWPKDKACLLNRIQGLSISRLGCKSNIVLQFDSWRLWESFAMGCTVFHVDFNKYNILLPEMPENWKHYIGVDLDNIDEVIERISDEPEVLKEVAQRGRAWALSHYGPLPVANRFLAEINRV